jgi:sulfoxide reductase catalytic subunit YedY
MDLLFDHYAPRAEYREEDISPFLWPNGRVPTSDEWTRLEDEEFRDYRVRVHGLVENPVELSLHDLREKRPKRPDHDAQLHQGWSAIGMWSGLPFAKLIELVRPSPVAKW